VPELLTAPNIIEYPFRRTTGPVIGAWFTGLREQVLLGIRAEDGRVLCPPIESDPVSGHDLTELVEVGPGGTVTTWSWNPTPSDAQPLETPFAWVLVRLDGADTDLLGALDAPAGSVTTGMRVRPRWAEQRDGGPGDLVCFEPEGGS
jgi:uncharacterized OB-fold protein